VATERFPGLNGARLLASVHIVLGHLYQMGAIGGDVYFFAWGYTWCPHMHLHDHVHVRVHADMCMRMWGYTWCPPLGA